MNAQDKNKGLEMDPEFAAEDLPEEMQTGTPIAPSDTPPHPVSQAR